MTQEFVTLPREVVEQALEALINEGEFRKLLKPLIEKSIDSIRAALEQPKPNSPEIPEGWRLVPVEPTDDMLYDIQEFSHILPPRGKRIWAHMLAAAPQPPTDQQPYLWYDAERDRLWNQEDAKYMDMSGTIPLYTHPQPKREPLTDDEIADAVRDLYSSDEAAKLGFPDDACTARAVERAHNIK